MNDEFVYKYRIKGKKYSVFYLDRNLLLLELSNAKDEKEKKLLSFIQDRSNTNIIDSLQNDLSYKMRKTLYKIQINKIHKYYCPFCEYLYEGYTLIRGKRIVDKGDLWYGEEYHLFCSKMHQILRVRGIVS